MATKAVDINRIFNYVPEDQRESDSPTVYRFRQMDSRLKAYIMARLREEKGSIEGTFAVAIDLFSICVVGFENFSDVDGAPVEFRTVAKDVAGRSRNVIIDDVLDKIPGHVFMQLFDEIFEKSSQSEDDKKN